MKTPASGSSITFATISTAVEFDGIYNDLAGNYLLTADIDLSSYTSWTPIGDYASSASNIFEGILNGNGCKVSNLTINTSSNYQGLFGYISGGAVSDLGLVDVDVTGYDYTGGLVGYNSSGTVTNSSVAGTVTGSNHDVGGLVGRNGGTVSNSYATGAVSGSLSVGGLVGENNNGVTNSYATGTVTGSSNTGGLVGYNNANVSYSFYDFETTGQSDTGKGYGKTTAQMKTAATFTGEGWDFTGETTNGTDDLWSIDSSVNGGYPYLTGLADSY